MPAKGALIAPYLADENPLVGHAVIAALGRIDERHGTQLLADLHHPTIEDLLTDAASADDVAVRKSAVTALGWFGYGASLDLLLSRLDDISEDVRDAAWQAIVRLGGNHLTALIQVFSDSTGDHRLSLAAALGEVGDPRALDTLVLGLRDLSEPVQAVCAESLGRLGDQRALDPLIERLVGATLLYCAEAIVGALGEIGGPHAVQTLLRLIEDPDEEVRNATAQSIWPRRPARPSSLIWPCWPTMSDPTFAGQLFRL